MADFDLIDTIDGTSKTSGTEFFTADITVVNGGVFRLEISTDGSAVIEVTFDSGANWTKLNGGTALAADNLHVFDVIVNKGDTFNMRQATGTVVLDIMRVYQAG